MCTSVFINKNGYKVEARSMDFPINIAFENGWSYVNVENTTDIVIDAVNIPKDQLTSWKNKYGYFGRFGFDKRITDGMNTQGLSLSILYLHGTIYPKYDPKDKRPVIAIYDITNFLLAVAKDVPEALTLIENHQIVNSAVELEPGIFVTGIPLHISLRDKYGNSAVLEFINGKIKIYPKAGDVLTNAPTYDWHLENIKEYKSLLKPQSKSKFADKTVNYNDVANSSRPEVAQLIGMPGDFSAASRFIRAYILSSLMPEPKSNREAYFHATSIIANTSVPPYEKSMTLWTTIKDLNNLTIAYKDNAVYQGIGTAGVYAMSIDSGYVTYDLKAMNFNNIPPRAQDSGIKPTDPNMVKQIVNMEDVVGLERQ
ncbi:linear amide C-N hydrolase [Allofrancisella frigidaquae]|uniref:Linear amide C-N hydrolase n=1 Tax=Allofrancisella frigidaquae TaxID=1085644 RepID=A0A6M3HTN1_9GAMM|nr:linear amide C-N hydrolase [Allofrancisella frigidaquae]KEI35838.1 choloylglycine hydrolase [Francisella sp. W12-1067]QIV94558.1 linear amide C-N hydrolase [Allofrancisella frigidaquae]